MTQLCPLLHLHQQSPLGQRQLNIGSSSRTGMPEPGASCLQWKMGSCSSEHAASLFLFLFCDQIIDIRKCKVKMHEDKAWLLSNHEFV